MGVLRLAAVALLVAFVVYLEIRQSSAVSAVVEHDLPHAPTFVPPPQAAAATMGRSSPALMPNQPVVEEAPRDRLVNQTQSTDGPPIPVLGVSVFVNAELLVRLLNSIDYHIQHIVIIHNGRHPGVAKVLSQLRREQPQWDIQSYPDNVGCAGAWNKIIEAVPGAAYYVITNDDIAFHPGALKNFAVGVEKHIETVRERKTNKVILYPTHENLYWASPPWSCFAILKHVIDTIGKFDDNFWPVYHEDYDYMARMARVGLWQTLIPTAKVQHGWSKEKYEPGMDRASKDQGKVAVLDEYKKQQERHERGSPYYALKWGIGETPGIYDAWNGYWNKTCDANNCTPQVPTLYTHPFNDSSLPLSFTVFDPELRRCLQYGGPKKCRYNWRLLPHPETFPHDMYMPGSRTWHRKDTPVPAGGGTWVSDKEIKALPGDDMHSPCYSSNCDTFGPAASLDMDYGTFFAFPGHEGFATYELTSCMRIVAMAFHSSSPCDAGDAREFQLQAAASTAGPWREGVRWRAKCDNKWDQSPVFSVDGTYLRVNILSNNGYTGGSRLPEVAFVRSKAPCGA